MATGGQKENGCSLINVEGVTLETTNNSPWYNGIVVCRDMIFVIVRNVNEVRLYGLQDGKLLYKSDTMESHPQGICLINDTEIAVIMLDDLIKITSIESTHNTRVITWTRILRVQGGLDWYEGVESFKDDFVVCGIKQQTVCWCIVSRTDGHVVGTIHQICKMKSTSWTLLTTKDNFIYISCYVDTPDTGVYGYDVQNPSKYKYRYQHKYLKQPTGIVIDQHGYLFVCNGDRYDCIHHLTSECQLVSIFTQGIPHDPFAIFWNNGLLYVTCYKSNHITIYRTQFPDAIWTKEDNPELYRNKNNNLLPMEEMNIISKTMSYSEDGKDVKESQEKDEDIGTHKNLGVQGETEVSQKGNLKAPIDQTETVYIHKLLAGLAGSVGIIKTSCGSGTGFRVGLNYVMTARHVIENCVMNDTVLKQQMHFPELHQQSHANVYIDFSSEWNSVPSDPDLIFYFEPGIEYESEYLDTVILKLKPGNKGYPPPLTNFIFDTRLSQDKSHGYFIGHSGATIKKTDKYKIVMLTPSDIYNAQKWSKMVANEDGYIGIDNQHRVLFHCSFEKGASGAPGFWINPGDGQAYVELMLVCGYPKWYYEKNEANVTSIPNNFLVEQGVSMKSLYDDMNKAKDELFCNTIFGKRVNIGNISYSHFG